MAFTFSSPPTYAQIAARCPGIGTVSSDYQTWMGNISTEMWETISSDFWGVERPLACALLTAHAYLREKVQATGGGGTAGPKTARSAGNWSETYAAPGSSSTAYGDADLATTQYGRDFLRLREGRAGLFPRVSL